MRSTFLVLSASLLFFASCSKNKKDIDGDEILIPNTPKTAVPAEAAGKWLNGTFSMSNWWSYNGTNYVGNPFSRSSAFNFLSNGDAEFYQVVRANTGTCVTEGYTYFKGTVAFDDTETSFTMYPQRGNYRGFYSCTPNQNFNRSATKDELDPIKMYWERWQDPNGQEYLLTAFVPNPPDQSEILYFKPAAW